MKFLRFQYILLSLILLLGTVSCQTESSKKVNQAKIDSLEKQTQHAMDSANDAILEQMNSVDDSDIVNDPKAPKKE